MVSSTDIFARNYQCRSRPVSCRHLHIIWRLPRLPRPGLWYWYARQPCSQMMQLFLPLLTQPGLGAVRLFGKSKPPTLPHTHHWQHRFFSPHRLYLSSGSISASGWRKVLHMPALASADLSCPTRHASSSKSCPPKKHSSW